MAARLQRFSPLLFGGLVVVAGAAVGVAAAPHVHRLDPFEVVALSMAAAVCGAACLLVVEPVWILTAGMLLSVFSGNWGNVGVHVPLDRVAIFGGIAAAVLRSLLQRGHAPDRASPRALDDGATAPVRDRLGRLVEHPDLRTDRCSRCSTDSAWCRSCCT